MVKKIMRKGGDEKRDMEGVGFRNSDLGKERDSAGRKQPRRRDLSCTERVGCHTMNFQALKPNRQRQREGLRAAQTQASMEDRSSILNSRAPSGDFPRYTPRRKVKLVDYGPGPRSRLYPNVFFKQKPLKFQNVAVARLVEF